LIDDGIRKFEPLAVPFDAFLWTGSDAGTSLAGAEWVGFIAAAIEEEIASNGGIKL
jgi:hypothetical protein